MSSVETPNSEKRLSKRQSVLELMGPAERPLKSKISFFNLRASSDAGGSSDDAGAKGRISVSHNVVATSLLGFLGTKRFLRKVTSKIWKRKAGNLSNINVAKEPTYRMQPNNKFNSNRVYETIKEIVDQDMKGFKYDSKSGAEKCKELSDYIKVRIKTLRFDRYKLVSLVIMGDIRDQSILVSSRCTWDVKMDNCATYTWKNDVMFCNATVYGIYFE